MILRSQAPEKKRFSVRQPLAAALAALVLAAGTTRSAADDPGHWGAIAYGANGVYGTARLFPDETVAARAAMQACGDKCHTVVTFLRQCAAFAAGKQGTGSVAQNRYLERARDEAMRECRSKDTDCKIRVTVCTHTE